ncbi:MAG TPA: HEAT repeat domain-containing protein, partial [Candidatus Eisenbacteria bacterium]|nr:HEAT repeat domain-containing protein [Candidatus Eisenbacteria bacterium]
AVAVKGTLVLALAALAALALRRSSSATRHAVWCAALTGMLMLPVLALAVPEWTLPILPAPKPDAPAAPASPVIVSVPQSPAVPAPAAHWHARAARSVSAPKAAPAPPVVPAPAVLQAPRAPATTAAPVLAARAVAEPTPRRPFTAWRELFLGLWIAGAVLVLLRVVAGHLALLRLAHRARPLHDARWARLAESAGEEAGIDRPFELLESDRIGVPATFGVVRPIVLLPTSARTWPEDRCRAVLVHELAHAARYDCFTQLLAQIACAVYWFHPAVWWAEKRMRLERETACDDRVLGHLSASDYADHLLEVLREARRPGLPAFGAVAFARRSSLEGRLLALLDPLRDRRSPSRPIAWSAGVTSAAILLVLAGAQLGAAPPASPKQDATPAAPPSVDARTADVRLAPDTEADLERRWAWALEGSARQAHGGMWIGYELKDVRAGGGHGLLSDSEGIDLALLNGHPTGPTLYETLARRGDFLSGAPAADGVALLFHVTRGGNVDRVRTQSFSLMAPLGGQPLYWLGKAGDAQSLAWLQRLEGHVTGEAARRALLDAASFHEDATTVNAWLGEVAQSGREPGLRAQAAEGLGRHPTAASIRVLDKLARQDRSEEVRRTAIETLGDVDDPAAASVLFDLARSRNDNDTRGQAIEALTDAAGAKFDEGADALADGADEISVNAEAIEKASKALEKSVESKCTKGETKCTQIKVEAMTQAATAVIENATEQAQTALEAAQEAQEAQEAQVDDDESDDVQVQVSAVQAIGKLPEAKGLPRLAQIARTHVSAHVRREAVDAIAQYQTPQALAELEELVWHAPDPAVQRQAVEGIGEFGAGRQLALLSRIARTHPQTEVRREAVETMANGPSDDVLGILEGIVKSDADVSVQLEAMEALANLPDHAGSPVLLRIAKSRMPARVRRQAIEQLGQSDPDAALPLLEEILKDKQPTP